MMCEDSGNGVVTEYVRNSAKTALKPGLKGQSRVEDSFIDGNCEFKSCNISYNIMNSK